MSKKIFAECWNGKACQPRCLKFTPS